MLRERKEKPPQIFFAFPIFSWRCCKFCDRQFRFERGYYSLAYPRYRKNLLRYWDICRHCAPTKQIAAELVAKKIKEVKYFIENFRPDAPPPARPRPRGGPSPYDASRAPGLRKSPRRRSSPYDCSSTKS